MVKVRCFFKPSVYCNCRFSENTADFDKFKYYEKLIVGNNFQPSQKGKEHQTPKSECWIKSKLAKQAW